MARYEEDYVQHIPVAEHDENRSETYAAGLGSAALTLSIDGGRSQTIDKRTIELTFAAGDAVISEAKKELVEAKTHAHQNKLQANVIGNGLLGRIGARASLIKGVAATTERAIDAQLKRVVGEVDVREGVVTLEASEQVAVLEAAAEEKIRLIREQLQRDVAHMNARRDEEVGRLHQRRSVAEDWAQTNLDTLAANRDEFLALYDDRAQEIGAKVEHQVTVNTAAHEDVVALERKLAMDLAELDRLRMRASELYDVYVQRVKDKEMIDERVKAAGEGINLVRGQVREKEAAISEAYRIVGQLEEQHNEALAIARRKYPHSQNLGEVLQHKDPQVVAIADQKNYYLRFINESNIRISELAGIEKARNEDRRPLLNQQGDTLRLMDVAQREAQEAFKILLRLQRSIVEECTQLREAAQVWMQRPVEITLDTDDVTAASDETVVESLTKGMTLSEGVPTIGVSQDTENIEFSEVESDLVNDDTADIPVVVPIDSNQPVRSQTTNWNNNVRIPLIHRVVDAAPSPGIITMPNGTEIKIACDRVAANE